jgi:hypothetical protein
MKDSIMRRLDALESRDHIRQVRVVCCDLDDGKEAANRLMKDMREKYPYDKVILVRAWGLGRDWREYTDETVNP